MIGAFAAEFDPQPFHSDEYPARGCSFPLILDEPGSAPASEVGAELSSADTISMGR
jgi:hypothetical protein